VTPTTKPPIVTVNVSIDTPKLVPKTWNVIPAGLVAEFEGENDEIVGGLKLK